jgi:hypothetical protein
MKLQTPIMSVIREFLLTTSCNVFGRSGPPPVTQAPTTVHPLAITSAPSTATALPLTATPALLTDTLKLETTSVAESPICRDEFGFRIAEVAYNPTGLGMLYQSMRSNGQIVWWSLSRAPESA